MFAAFATHSGTLKFYKKNLNNICTYYTCVCVSEMEISLVKGKLSNSNNNNNY